MSNVQFTKFNCFTPIVPNTVDGTLVFETCVNGISTEDDLRQAADMICDGLRRHLIGDEKKAGDSADNVRKWMDEAPDGDGATTSGEEDADDQAGRRETAAQRVLPQRQYVHVSLPGGGHISLPEDYVFFGPAGVFKDTLF